MLANMQCFGASKVPDEKNKKINAPFGIDLGTTNSALFFRRDNTQMQFFHSQ